MRILTAFLTAILLLAALSIGGYYHLKSELTYLKIYTPKISFETNKKDDIFVEIYDDVNNIIYKKVYQRSKLLPKDYDTSLAYYLIEEMLSKDSRFSEVYSIDSWKYLIMSQLGMDIYSLRGQVINHFASELLKDKDISGFYGEVLRWYTLDSLKNRYSKDELCRLYLDTFEYGNRIYGLAAASEHYFRKTVDALSVLELSYLISMRTFSGDEDVNEFHQELAKMARRNIKGLYEAGMISGELYQKEANRIINVSKGADINLDPAFSEEIIKQVKQTNSNIVGKNIVKIRTNYSQSLTKALEDSVKEYMKDKDSNQQAMAVLVDRSKAAIVATVGSRVPKSSRNRAFYLYRQVASTFKPIVYLTAFSVGVSPMDTIIDKPYTFKSGGVDYKPNNYLSAFYGKIMIRTGLTHSLNNATIKLAENVGLEKVSAMAKALGADGNVPAYHAMALGAVPMTAVNLAQVFSTIANMGVKYTPKYIKSIEYGNKIINYESRRQRVVDEASVYQVLYIMQSVAAEGTARSAYNFEGTATKTGTTDNYRDAWTVAIFDKYVLVVWIGYDDSRSMGEDGAGGKLAAPFVTVIQNHIYKEKMKFSIQKPNGIQMARVNQYTGDYDPSDMENTYVEALKINQYAEVVKKANTSVAKADSGKGKLPPVDSQTDKKKKLSNLKKQGSLLGKGKKYISKENEKPEKLLEDKAVIPDSTDEVKPASGSLLNKNILSSKNNTAVKSDIIIE